MGATSMITCIAKIKDGYTIVDVASEIFELLGIGGNPEADHIEEYIGWVNTPVQYGNFRATFDEQYIPYLEGIKQLDAADSAEVIEIEADGQIEFIVKGADAENPWPERLGYCHYRLHPDHP